jgi:hypothetical protein
LLADLDQAAGELAAELAGLQCHSAEVSLLYRAHDPALAAQPLSNARLSRSSPSSMSLASIAP